MLTNTVVPKPDRALRVHVEPARVMQVHATATGVVIAAFSATDMLDEMTQDTSCEALIASTPKACGAQVLQAGQTGIACLCQRLAYGVVGLAAALFRLAGLSRGAVAVAAVAQPHDRAMGQQNNAGMRAATLAITKDPGGILTSHHPYLHLDMAPA